MLFDTAQCILSRSTMLITDYCVTQVVDYPAHNYSLFILGVMILWFGWYGFNPGSQTAILLAGTSNPVQVAAVATTLAPATSGLTALFVKAAISKMRTGVPPLLSCTCTQCPQPSLLPLNMYTYMLSKLYWSCLGSAALTSPDLRCNLCACLFVL